MNESKLELTKRLQREGRWSEASLFKDVALKDFRAQGMKRAEASDAAWEAMAAAFPPPPLPEQSPEPTPATEPPVEPSAKLLDPKPDEPFQAAASPRGQNGHGVAVAPEEDFDVDALLEREGNQQPDLVRDTLWAYQHLANRKAKPEDAPSLGAWSLLQWARKYQNRFFEQVLPLAMKNKPAEDEENIRGERKSIDQIRRILEKFREAV